MFGVSHLPELLILLVIGLVIFGPKRLPEIGNALGKSITEFRKGTSHDDSKDHEIPERVASRPVEPEVPPAGTVKEREATASAAKSERDAS